MTDPNNSQDKPLNRPANSGNSRRQLATRPEAFHQGIARGQPDQVDPVLKSKGQEEALTPQELAQIWARRAYELAEEPPAPTLGQTLDLLVFGWPESATAWK